MKTPKPKEERIPEQSHSNGDWSCHIYGAKTPSKQALLKGKPIVKDVEIHYQGKCRHATHGLVAFENAKALVDQMGRTGYVPKLGPVKCMADYGESKRSTIGGQGGIEINTTHVGEGFLEGLRP